MTGEVTPSKKTPLVVTGGVGLLAFFLVGQAFAVSIVTDIVTSLMIFGVGFGVGKFGWK